MCSYIVEKAALFGSAKGPKGWMHIDHRQRLLRPTPYHAPLDHALGIDFICEAEGGRDRVAVEISAERRSNWSRKSWPRWQVATRARRNRCRIELVPPI